MHELPTDLDQLLFRQSYVLTAAQALRYFSRSAIRHRVRTERWQQPARAVFIVKPADHDVQRRWVAVLGGPPGAVTAGRTALTQCGLRGFDRRAIHLLIPHATHARSAPAGVLHHRTRLLPAEQVHQLGSPPCALPARALVDAAQWAGSDNEARTLVAATFQQRLVRADDVRSVLAALRVIRRNVIVAAVNDADAGAHSLPELEFLALCRRARLPVPRMQVRRTDARGQH